VRRLGGGRDAREWPVNANAPPGVALHLDSHRLQILCQRPDPPLFIR
jgi:hypothetical protein